MPLWVARYVYAMSIPRPKPVTNVRKASATEKLPDRSMKSNKPPLAASSVGMSSLLSCVCSAGHEDRSEPVIVVPVAGDIETQAVLAHTGELQVVARDEVCEPVRHSVVRFDLEHGVPGRKHVLAGMLRIEPQVVDAVPQVEVD